MEIVWGVVLIVLGLLAWGGQGLSYFAPGTAEKLNLTEGKERSSRSSGLMAKVKRSGSFSFRWILVVAGVLLLLDHDAGPHSVWSAEASTSTSQGEESSPDWRCNAADSA